jgi:LmbE family N-acetylglucosaminyl deacetylase
VAGRELDEDKLRTLANWATGLREDPRPEVGAAGRAIEMLIEEVERLHVLLWDRQLFPADHAAGAAVVAEAVADDAAEGDAALESAGLEDSLRRRIVGRWRRSPAALD